MVRNYVQKTQRGATNDRIKSALDEMKMGCSQSRSEGVANEATAMGGKLARRQISKFNKHFLIYEMF